MISIDCSEGGFNGFVYVEALLVNEVVQAVAVELPLDFREDRLDGIEFRRVNDVPNGLHVKFCPPLFDAWLLVDVQIVHKQ